jgi:hypothetical protein
MRAMTVGGFSKLFFKFLLQRLLVPGLPSLLRTLFTRRRHAFGRRRPLPGWLLQVKRGMSLRVCRLNRLAYSRAWLGRPPEPRSFFTIVPAFRNKSVSRLFDPFTAQHWGAACGCKQLSSG